MSAEPRLDPRIQRLVVRLTGVICDLVFRKLNRTTILGRCPDGPLPRTVVYSNHQSLLDSFLVGGLMCYPELYRHPERLHYQLADGLNFMADPLMRQVYRYLNVIPVGRDAAGARRDRAAFRRMVEVVSAGGMGHIFIEGTRSTTRELLPPVASAAGIAVVAEANILPVYFTGMDEVQPYRKKIGDPPITWRRFILGQRIEWLTDMRFGKRLTIAYGDLISAYDVQTIAGTGPGRSERVAEVVMDRLRSLKSQVDSHHYGCPSQRLAS